MDGKTDGLTVLVARRGFPFIEVDVPTHEISAMLSAGKIVIIKSVFDPVEMRRVHAAILGCKMPDSSRESQVDPGKSFRKRVEIHPNAKLKVLFDTYFFAMNDPIGRASIAPEIQAPFCYLAEYWRALTDGKHDFMPDANGRAMRCWAMHYPCGGGYFDWHEHPLEPTKIGMILNITQIGVDYSSGATEFKTPYGIVNTMTSHDIGDICLFRYDLSHRVTPIDPDFERRWDDRGRWTMLMLVSNSPAD